MNPIIRGFLKMYKARGNEHFVKRVCYILTYKNKEKINGDYVYLKYLTSPSCVLYRESLSLYLHLAYETV